MSTTATQLRTDLSDRFEQAVVEAALHVAGFDAQTISVEEQERHIERTVVCQFSLFGAIRVSTGIRPSVPIIAVLHTAGGTS